MNSFTRYVVLLHKIPGVETPVAGIRDHISFLRRITASGHLEMAGPFSDFEGGMLILRAASPDEARAIAESDPFVKSGVRKAEIRTWHLSCEENNHMGMG